MADNTEDVRSLPPDERVRRARELAAEMRRQREAERAAQGLPPVQRAAAPRLSAEPAAERPATDAGAPSQEPAPQPEPVPVAAMPPIEVELPPPPETPFSWRLAGGPARRMLSAIRAEAAAARARTPVAVTPRRRGISRRAFLLGGFWTGLGLALTTALGGLDFLFPRKVVGFGGPIPVAAEQIPRPGDPPVHIIRGKFWLANLQPGEGASGEFGEPSEGGLLAMWQKCPHLGCTVPWRQDFVFGGTKGWFRCPCHGSTYTKGGVRVFGPAPRPLDTMTIQKQADGSIIVQTGDITVGGNDNPRRTVPYP